MSRALCLCCVALFCLMLSACGDKSSAPKDQLQDQKSAPTTATAEAQSFLGGEIVLL